MKTRTIRWVIVLATISLTGIIIIQILWFNKAFQFKEKQIDQTIYISLKTVAEKMLMYNNNPAILIDPVTQVSSNYYTVMINDIIHAETLELYLKSEFQYRGLFLDFEYGIYDCTNKKMVYGNYIESDKASFRLKPDVPSPTVLPALTRDNYYFGIYFPNRSEYMLGQMDMWIFTSLVLLVVVIFFAYTIWVLLRQKRLSEIQRDFINNMTHEFKTPISTISISSEVLMKPDIIKNPERLLNYATIIHNENKRLKKQVEKILQMATVEKENLKLQKEALDIHELIRKVVRNMEATLKDVQGEITLFLDKNPVIINADNLHLTNILYNLLDNAIKYSKENPKIEIHTQNQKNGVLLTVKDCGIGISKEDKKLVFDKFYRVPKGDVHDVKGFGLGLNYVKVMTETHKGNIKVESELGKGSSFLLYLPK